MYNNKLGLQLGRSKTGYIYHPINGTYTNNKVDQNTYSSGSKCVNIVYEGTGSTWSSNLGWKSVSSPCTLGSTNGVTESNTSINYAAYEAAALTSSQVGPNAP